MWEAADPAHLSLLSHVLQRLYQVLLLGLLDTRTPGVAMELHHVHIVGLQTLETFMQAAKEILSRPDIWAAAARSAAALGRQEVF